MTTKWTAFPPGASISSSNVLVGLQGGENVSWTFAQLLVYVFSYIFNPAPQNVTSSGTYAVPSTNYGDVLVNVAGLVTIDLPASASRDGVAISVVDVGGHALSYPITIVPYGSETIMSLSTVTISNDYGAVTLWPLSTGGWYQK